MDLPEITTREQWLAARTALLTREKELTRARDAVNADRRRLPMVEITEDYRFDGPDGPVGLLDLFDGRSQLLVGHVMFDPAWDEACPSCSAGMDELSDGLFRHLHARDTTYVTVSRAPLEKIRAYADRRGYIHPWYSSHGSTFNHDFGVTLDPAVAPPVYNYRPLTEGDFPMELPGTSCFLRVGDRAFHTYSHFARGAESTGGSYYFLDLTALGRQEEWEEPKGRSAHASRPDFAE